MLEVRNALNRYRFIVEQGNTPLMFSFNQAFWRDWKKTKGAILAFRDPFPAFDRPKNMTQVLKKRSMHNFMHLKNLRLRLYLGYKKEYQYRQYLLKARNFMSITFTEKMFLYLEGNVSHMMQRFGFAKNAEIALDMMKHGHVRANYVEKITKRHQLKTYEVFQVKTPKWQQDSDEIKNITQTLHYVTHPSHLVVNWKLNTIRFVGKPKSRHFSHPHMNLKANDVAFYYSH
jgi:ribosomal protein S4